MPRRRTLPLVDLRLLTGAQHGQADNVRYALEMGRSPDLCDGRGRSALLRACRGEAWVCVDLLLAAGADPNRADSAGCTPLHTLASMTDLRDDGMPTATLQRLLDAGADPNRADDLGMTPLMQALDHPERVRMLLNAGANPSAQTGIALKGATVLTLLVINGVGPDAAVRSRNVASLTAILAAGADPNAIDANGRTPLILTVDEPLALPLAQALLDAGADPDLVAPRFGHSPRARTGLFARPMVQALFEQHLLRATLPENLPGPLPRGRRVRL